MTKTTELKKLVAARLESAESAVLEGAGDTDAASTIMSVHNDARDKLISLVLPFAGSLAKTGLAMMSRMMVMMSDVEDAKKAGAPSEIIKVANDRIAELTRAIYELGTTPVMLNNGCKLRMVFGDPTRTSVKAQYDLRTNMVELVLIGLMETVNIKLSDIAAMDSESISSTLYDIVRKEWNTAWTEAYERYSVPVNIYHELRHAFDDVHYPKTMAHSAGQLVKVNAFINSLQKKATADLEKIKAEEFNDSIMRTGQADVTGIMKRAIITSRCITKYYDDLMLSNYCARMASKSRGILKDIIRNINARGVMAEVKKTEISSDLKQSGIELDENNIEQYVPKEIRSAALSCVLSIDIYNHLSYLSSSNEINARIAEYLPKIAMMRSSNSSVIDPEVMKKTLSEMISQIGVQVAISDEIRKHLTPEDQENLKNCNHMANKAILKRLYVAMDAANHIKIDPNDDCSARLDKMTRYLAPNTETKLPNRERTVVPPPPPRHPKPVYRGGYVK